MAINNINITTTNGTNTFFVKADAGTFDLRVEDTDDSSRYDQIDVVVVASGDL